MTEPSATPPRSFDVDTEPPELSGMIGRVLRSLVRRAEGGDIDALMELRVIAAAVTTAEVDAARGLVEGPGRYSWGEVARWVGVSRQAAHKRYRRGDG
jgi:hypothetical protein